MKMSSKPRIIFVVLLVLLAAGYFYSRSRSRVMMRLHGSTMGTQYTILVSELAGASRSEKGLQAGIDRLLELVNQQMSTYIDNSQISLFNKHLSTKPFAVGPEFYEVARAAKVISEKFGKTFDPTLSPLVDLWGFGPKARPTKIPDADAIEAVLKTSGVEKLSLQETGGQGYLVKKDPDLQLDFSAIAKGYAVDLISRYLTKVGHNNHMVEIGGEIRVSGLKAPGTKWSVGIEKPVANVRTGISKLTITNNSIATSGSYRNYYELNGQRFSHTIDPRTGRPITHNMISVSVIAKSCMFADAFATAAMAMGPEETLRYANQNNLAVYLLVKNGEQIEAKKSRVFAASYKVEEI